MQNVENKVVVITGASSGIGEATARLLARHGARVVLAARREASLSRIAEDIAMAGGDAIYQVCDVTDAAQVTAVVDMALEAYGRIDVMFNNAGVMPLAPMNALKTDEWNAMVDINIKGVLNGIAAALPVMERQGRGHIINTASTAGHSVTPTAAVYCATKFAVRAISDGLRQESDTVRVTIISPGVTETELGHDITDETAKGFLETLRDGALEAEDIARAVVYAISQPENADVGEIVIRPLNQSI